MLFLRVRQGVAGAVTISGVIALTLSPMMCSRLLHAHRADKVNWETRVIEFIDFVETTWGIGISDEDITKERMGSLNKMAALVQHYAAQKK